MTGMRLAAMLAAAAAVAFASGAAFGQTAPADVLAPGAGANIATGDAPPPAEPAAKHKRKPDKSRHRESGLLAVTVHNERSVGMVELRLGPAGAPELKKVVGALAFGRKTVIHLKRTKDCLYDIHAHFADDANTDQTGVDLCKDKTLNLTD
jgi:hypothetical protein